MLLDIVAVILGVFYTVRKLDIRKREPAKFPHVPGEEFMRWRDREAGAYSLASAACFLKLILDYAFLFVARKAELDAGVVRTVGASLFAAWLVALIVSFLRMNAARKMREHLEIDLSAQS